MKTIAKFGVLFVVIGMLAVASVASARSLTEGHGIPIVNDPHDLNLVDLQPLSAYLNQDLRNKGSFGIVRRTALNFKARQVGIPDPRKAALHAGIVLKRGQSGLSSAVLVILGDIRVKDFRKTLERDYREYMQRIGGTPKITEVGIGGVPLQCFAYSERPYDVYVGPVPMKRMMVWAAVPRDDRGVLEETILVLQGKEPLNPSNPRAVEAGTTFSLTDREVRRLASFNRSKGKLRATLAKGMKNLAKNLGIAHSEDDTVPLDERIRHGLSRSKTISVDYRWDLDDRNASSYKVKYTMAMSGDDGAKDLYELLHEKMVRLGEQTPHQGEANALGKIAVDQAGAEVTLEFLLDSPEAQYEHVSLLLNQLFRYRNVMGFLDRHGSRASQ